MQENQMSDTTSARSGRERGQTTSEYALVLLAAGTIAMLALSWAQGSEAISGLFDAAMTRLSNLLAE